VILIDANVFMYAAGAEHQHKAPSVGFLRRIALGEIAAAVDAEVLQEILHRYRAIRRWEEGRAIYALARRIVPLVVAITDAIVDRARDLLDDDARLGPRDALHAAVVLDHGMEGVCSYDRDLDRVVGLRRLEPPLP
jgi:predicted nucleic acid-binding protein